jgi:hypothetical protein
VNNRKVLDNDKTFTFTDRMLYNKCINKTVLIKKNMVILGR